MRIFLITLAVSIGGTIVFWNFGIAQRLWPAHPMLATCLIIGAIAIALQLLLSDPAGAEPAKTISRKRT